MTTTKGEMMTSLQLKPTVQVDGRDWHLFDIEFQTADGKFGTYIYALSHEHAELMLSELKETARVSGQVCGFERAGGAA
jgi:hypothetical protein